MIMTQNGTAHDRKVGVGAQEIMRELFDKVKQLNKCIVIDLHRNVLSVKYDTVLIVVHIR